MERSRIENRVVESSGKVSISLGLKIILAMAIVLVLLATALGTLLHQNTTQAVERAVAAFGEQVAAAASAQFDAERYAAFLADAQENELYWELRHALNQVRETTGALYVYTMRIEPGLGTYIMIDGQPADSDVASPLNEPAHEEGDLSYLERLLAGETVSTGIVDDPDYGLYLSAYAPIRGAVGEVIGVLGFDVAAGDIQAITGEVLRESRTSFFVLGALALAALLLVFWFVHRVLKPLRQVTVAAGQIAAGDFAQAREALRQGTRGRDEIGQLYGVIVQMREQLERLLGTAISEAAVTSERVAGLSSAFAGQAHAMVEGSTRMTDRLNQLVDRSHTQLQGAEDTARSMQEISTGLHRMAAASQTVADHSAQALTEAREGQERIQRVDAEFSHAAQGAADVLKLVESLCAQTASIGKVLAVVSGVSQQTKMLALNASIEAARAGEHGKGFAVVAAEVGKLAGQSREAVELVQATLQAIEQEAQLLRTQMSGENAQIQQGRQLASQAAAAFARIVDLFQSAAVQLEEVSAAHQEITAGAAEVAAAAQMIAEAARMNVDQAAEASSLSDSQLTAVEQMAEEAAALQQDAGRLQQAMKEFKL